MLLGRGKMEVISIQSLFFIIEHRSVCWRTRKYGMLQLTAFVALGTAEVAKASEHFENRLILFTFSTQFVLSLCAILWCTAFPPQPCAVWYAYVELSLNHSTSIQALMRNRKNNTFDLYTPIQSYTNRSTLQILQ